jgi:hypothetical protein
MCCVRRLAMDLPVCCVVMPADEAKAAEDRAVSQAEVEAQVHFLVLLSSSTV